MEGNELDILYVKEEEGKGLFWQAKNWGEKISGIFGFFNSF